MHRVIHSALNNSLKLKFAALLLLFTTSFSSFAALIEIQDNSFVFRDTIGLNPFVSASDRLVFSAKVNVDGSAPSALNLPVVTRDTAVTSPNSMPFRPSPAIPNQFAESIAFNAVSGALDWTYRADLGSDFDERVVPALPQSVIDFPVALATDATIDGSGEVSWVPSTTPAVNRLTIDILQGNLSNIVAQSRGPLTDPSTTAFNLSDLADSTKFFNPSGFNPQPGDEFVIRIRQEIRDNSRVDQNGQPIGSQIARSSTFKSVTVLPAGSPAVYLPTVDTSGVFNFDMAVQADNQVFIDPEVAVGYDYSIGIGDPLFTSVLLPVIGDNIFDLWLFDMAGVAFDTGIDLLAGVEFDFTSDLLSLASQLGYDPSFGIDMFRILGIETSAGLDPSDVTAFVTGLKFAQDGRFTGTMTPITADVPEPSTLALMVLGLMGLMRLGRRNLSMK